ncbi:MAG: hypothetical protein E6F99_01670 [Actinobacteria bacterium]|nr:MAG: hypothetical protein E6F99_01670 [Actinomycetota bacterium]
MLFLKTPYALIEGVAVFGDHADPLQYYYLPAMPRLRAVRDPATGVDVPQVQLLKFRGGAGNGGFLTFEVDLAFDQTRLDNVAAELRRIYRLDGAPRLAPVPLEDGTVRLIILGQQSAAPPGPGGGGGGGGATTDDEPRFVQKIDPPFASKPALYGDNQAIFSVQLDQSGVELIEASLLQGQILPVGVVYALDFFALRPAFTVRVTADWNRVQKHFDDSFGFDVLFSSVEIDKVVDQLIEDRVVTIDVDSFLPEGEEGGSWVGRRDQAVKDFKDMILGTFFQPSIEPIKQEEDGWDKFTHTAERLSLLAATGGWGGAMKFHHVKRDITRIDTKVANLTMNERVTVKRSIYPQANLKSLGATLRDLIERGKIDRSLLVQEVTLGSAWFASRQVTAHALVNFDHDDVEAVTLTLSYGDQPQTLRLTKDTASGARQWNSILVGNAMKREVEYSYRISFRDVDTAERPGVVDSPQLVARGDEFDLSPRGEGVYFVDEITFGADTLPWDRYPTVSVEARYTDDEHRIRLAETFLLTKASPEATWRRFRLNPDLDTYQVNVTYLAADHRDVSLGWRSTDEERLVIRDPRPAKRSVQVVPAVPWALVAMVLVEVTYDDVANDVHERQTLSFMNTDTDRLPKTFSANLVDPDQRFVGYSATILLSDNRIITVPPSVTAGPAIFIRTDMIGHRVVAVRPPSVDFGVQGLLRVEADLSFADADAGLSFADTYTFFSAKDSGVFEYDYVAAERNRYHCRVRGVHSNGLVQERDLGMLDGDRLILPVA